MLDAELVTVHRVGQLLTMRPATVYEWARLRRVPSYKVGRSLRFRLDEIEAAAVIHRAATRPLRESCVRVYRAAMPKRAGGEKKERGVYERRPGSGIWWVRYADQNGKIHREPVGPRVLALDVYRKRKTEVAEQRFFPDRRSMKMTVKEAIARHLDARKKSRTFSDMETYGEHWTDELGTRRLTAVRPEHVQAYVDRRIEELSESTVNHEIKFLRCVFNTAIHNRWCLENPVRHVVLFKEPPGRIRFLSEEEEAKLAAFFSPENWALVEFAIHTGLRRSEQFGLEWANVDLERRILTVPRSKNGERRHVPINDAVLEILRDLPSRLTSRYVFTAVGGDGPRDSHKFYKRNFQKSLLKAGIEDFRWHDLRHTFASRLVMAGVDLRTVQELMGHKSIQMTQRYAHLSPAHQLAAVQRLVGQRAATDTFTDTEAKGAER